MSVKQLINQKLQNGKLTYLEDDITPIQVTITERMLSKYEESLLKTATESKPA